MNFFFWWICNDNAMLELLERGLLRHVTHMSRGRTLCHRLPLSISWFRLIVHKHVDEIQHSFLPWFYELAVLPSSFQIPAPGTLAKIIVQQYVGDDSLLNRIFSVIEQFVSFPWRKSQVVDLWKQKRVSSWKPRNGQQLNSCLLSPLVSDGCRKPFLLN